MVTNNSKTTPLALFDTSAVFKVVHHDTIINHLNYLQLWSKKFPCGWLQAILRVAPVLLLLYILYRTDVGQQVTSHGLK